MGRWRYTGKDRKVQDGGGGGGEVVVVMGVGGDLLVRGRQY